jgi:intracellular sulfur oxidation DsrE/DsrF family protein
VLGVNAVPSVAGAERVLRSPSDDPDKWLDSLKGKHRQIYDVLSPQSASEGTAFTRNFLNANNDAYGLTDADVNVVISFRHAAFAFGLNDTMWEKYHLGELLTHTDTRTGAPAIRNTLLGREGDTGKNASNLTALHSRGAVFTVCGMAMRAYSREAAQKANTDGETALTEFRANLVLGAIEVAAGVIAVNRAQEHGLSYVYVG